MNEIEKWGEGQPQRISYATVDPPIVENVSEPRAEGASQVVAYWRVIQKRRWVVLSSLLIVVSTVAIGTLKEKPVYQASALIEIDPEPPNVLNFKEILQLSASDVDSYLETQYRILSSRTLAERVIKDLQLYKYPEFYRRLRLFGLIVSMPKAIPLASNQQPPDLDSDVYLNTVMNFLSEVDVSPVRRSNLVEVRFSAQDPALASQIANRLASDYIDENLEVKWDETTKASEFLQQQLVKLKANLEKSDDALQAYAQKNSILFIAEKQNLVNARLEQLQQEYTKAQTERFQKEALFNLVQSGQPQDLPGTLSNQLIQNLTAQQAEEERQYAELTSRVTPNYPKAVALYKQILTTRTAIEQEKKSLAHTIVDEYHSSLANEQYLGQALEQQKKEVNDIAEKTIQYNILKREVDTNKQLFENLLQRLKEAQVSAGLKASNIRIVDTADIPKAPIKPRTALNLVMGVLFGMGLGVGLAFFQEFLDNTVKTPDEVESLIRLPALGFVPIFSLNNKAGKGEKPGLGQGSGGRLATAMTPGIQSGRAVLEALRTLRTSVLLSASPAPRMILLTSALPSEGKTTIAVNLGATLASLGSRVVVLDCDMRRPACHRATGVKNLPGFVECLAGRATLGEATTPVKGIPNLYVIPCGPIPPNPAELLSSPLARDLFHALRPEFDYVLVDSPPLMSVSDGRILATLVDAVVLVVRANRTPYDVVRRARASLHGAGARILGVALNNVDVKGAAYSYGYYHEYGNGYYGYGYGYGDGQDSDGETSDDRLH
jgi:polysaccharide biosynthesis transport protein